MVEKIKIFEEERKRRRKLVKIFKAKPKIKAGVKRSIKLPSAQKIS